MKYRRLGDSDLIVSEIALGCMSFGDKNVGDRQWILDQERTTEIVKEALSCGINFFDTANCYAEGSSEVYLGNALKTLGVKREDVIIASKVYFNEGKLSREAILREIEKSLKALQTDYLDLYIIHRFDYDTPIAEVMSTLNELIERGLVRYIGASSMYSYQLLYMNEYARAHNMRPFISMQNHYNLLYREEEREMMRLLECEGMSSTPYSPLAAGRLARLNGDTLRNTLDLNAKNKYDRTMDSDYEIVSRVNELASKHNTSMSSISLAWLLHKKCVSSVIVGVTKLSHLTDACNALDIALSGDEIAYLEEPYLPHRLNGPR